MNKSIDESALPAYIKKLLSPDLPLDYHIIVGTSEFQVKFGVDKWMLAVRSEPLRRMMLLRPKGLDLSELDPGAFKEFLIYCYGHDHISTLPFNKLILLLTIAELYDVPDLKTKVSETLKPQITPDNVLVALKHGHICDKIQELWEITTEVIQNKTEHVFSNPEFRNASKDVLLYIVQQDSLSVPEINVWKAALDWAKYQDPSPATQLSSCSVHVPGELEEETVSPENLRKTLLPMLKHIRFCTMSRDQVMDEVFTTEILSGKEMALISGSIKEQKECASLEIICNKIDKRNVPSVVIEFGDKTIDSFIESSVILTACKSDIQLISITLLANSKDLHEDDDIYNFSGYITVKGIQSSNDKVVSFDEKVSHGSTLSVELSNYVLPKNMRINISVLLDELHVAFKSQLLFSEYIKATCYELKGVTEYHQKCYGTHIKAVQFKVLK